MVTATESARGNTNSHGRVQSIHRESVRLLKRSILTPILTVLMIGFTIRARGQGSSHFQTVWQLIKVGKRKNTRGNEAMGEGLFDVIMCYSHYEDYEP